MCNALFLECFTCGIPGLITQYNYGLWHSIGVLSVQSLSSLWSRTGNSVSILDSRKSTQQQIWGENEADSVWSGALPLVRVMDETFSNQTILFLAPTEQFGLLLMVLYLVYQRMFMIMLPSCCDISFVCFVFVPILTAFIVQWKCIFIVLCK